MVKGRSEAGSHRRKTPIRVLSRASSQRTSGGGVVEDDEPSLRRRAATSTQGDGRGVRRSRCYLQVQSGIIREDASAKVEAHVGPETRQGESLHDLRAVDPGVEELTVVGDGE